MATLYGDTFGNLTDHQKGGDQAITLPGSVDGTAYGDANAMCDFARGGNDVLIGGDGGATTFNSLFGDAQLMYGHTVGGDDVLIGASNTLVGDAAYMYDHASGGDDVLTGGADALISDQLYGDAQFMYGNTVGGDDVLTGGDRSANQLFGDALVMYDRSVGGNDVLTGGVDAGNNVIGDAGYMYGNAVGGDDVLTGGDGTSNNFNTLIGDAFFAMYDNAVGGNDVLTAGDGAANLLVGDAEGMYDNAVGGNDKLISGTGTDDMWGDGQFGGAAVKGGADVFLFKPASGNDFIFDFRDTDNDKIEVSGYGYHNIGQLDITGNGSDTQINFSGGNSVTLVGWADPTLLSASDFIFK